MKEKRQKWTFSELSTVEWKLRQFAASIRQMSAASQTKKEESMKELHRA